MHKMLRCKDLIGLTRNRVPGQLVIQFTDHCNARCPQCGMRVTERFSRSKLSQGDVEKTLDAAAKKGFQVVSFTGGEPLLFPRDLASLIHYAGKVGIKYIRTGTNGYIFAKPDAPSFTSRMHTYAQTLAATPLRNFWISLDSAVPSVHEQMRGFPGLIKGIEKGLPIFHDHGLFPAANLGINRRIGADLTEDLPSRSEMGEEEYLQLFYYRFQEGFRRFFRFVIDLGFTMVNMCYPMSFEPATFHSEDETLKPVYAANSTDGVVRFDAREKTFLFKAIADTIPEFRSRIRIFTPRSSLMALHRHYSDQKHTPSYPCRGGVDFFFVDAKDGNAYPCGFRGSENLGKFWEMNADERDPQAHCRLCDWECFRDPSELFGPVLEGLTSPLSLLRRFKQDPPFLRLWAEDLRYYRACDLFDGRKSADMSRLAAFRQNGTAAG